MRTCACLNTNSDRIPIIQLIKMHVNDDGDMDGDLNDDDDDGFCGYEIFPSSYHIGVVPCRPKKLVCARTHLKRV